MQIIKEEYSRRGFIGILTGALALIAVPVLGQQVRRFTTTPIPAMGEFTMLPDVRQIDALLPTTEPGDYLVGPSRAYFARVRPKSSLNFPPHPHKYDHFQTVLRGEMEILLWLNGEKEPPVVYPASAGHTYLIPGGIKHGVKYTSDDPLFACIFAHRDKDGNVVDVPMSRDAYE